MKQNIFVLAVLMFLGGCAGLPQQAFNSGAETVRTIAVAPPHHDGALLLRYRKDQLESIDLFTQLPIARAFTFIAEENREAAFTGEFDGEMATYAQKLQQQLQRLMTEAGFKTVPAPALNSEALPRDRHGLLRVIPATAFGGADALLETSGEIGFTAAGRGKPFQPTVWLKIRLTATDGDVLLQDQILFNPPKNRARGILLYPTGEFKFENRQALLDSDRAALALAQAITAVSHEVAFLLRGPGYAIQ